MAGSGSLKRKHPEEDDSGAQDEEDDTRLQSPKLIKKEFNEEKMVTNAKSTASGRERVKGIKFPAKLPTLTPYLLKWWEDKGLEAVNKALIQFWSRDLENRTGKPSKEDYTNYAKSLVEKYPTLKDRSPDGLVSIAKTIHLS